MYNVHKIVKYFKILYENFKFLDTFFLEMTGKFYIQIINVVIRVISD